MSYPLSARMSEILALTKAGRVADATALIQRGLNTVDDAAAAHGAPADLRRHKTALPPLIEIASARTTATNFRKPAESEGSFDRHSFGVSLGSLDYLLYVPATITAPAPLVVMLHGCTQSADDFARGTQMNALADELGFIVAYPEQSRSANAQKCWNWFRPGDQGKAAGEPAMIAAITREIAAKYPVEPDRIYVAGLSAGGAAAAIMASAFPDIYAAAGIHSGLACGSAQDLPSALAAMQGRGKRRRAAASQAYVPLITFHGDRDGTVHPANSDQIHAAWDKAPAMAGLEREVTEGTDGAGRAYRKTAMVDRDGRSMSESWLLKGAGHAWSGGSAAGSYTDEGGPDASREMMRFFVQHRRT